MITIRSADRPEHWLCEGFEGTNEEICLNTGQLRWLLDNMLEATAKMKERLSVAPTNAVMSPVERDKILKHLRMQSLLLSWWKQYNDRENEFQQLNCSIL